VRRDATQAPQDPRPGASSERTALAGRWMRANEARTVLRVRPVEELPRRTPRDDGECSNLGKPLGSGPGNGACGVYRCDLGHRARRATVLPLSLSPSWAFPPLTWAARHAPCGPFHWHASHLDDMGSELGRAIPITTDGLRRDWRNGSSEFPALKLPRTDFRRRHTGADPPCASLHLTVTAIFTEGWMLHRTR
jgi:hypothetical protein